IDWHPLKSDLRDKVLLPILSDQYGRVLERGELQVHFEEGTFYLRYGDRRLPIAPGTYRYVLEIALQNLAEHKDEDFYAEVQSILTALEYLPKRTETDPKRIAERIREKEIIKRRLERRCAEAPQVQHAIEKALARINGEPGDPRSFDALDELLNAQSYRLAFWRVAAEEINYRRFFDVNDLAAIRVELPKVFDAVHRLLLELVQTRAVTALRIDHPDGLYLPREYFEKIQQRCAKALAIALPQDGRAIYMVAEKILTGAEPLRKDWLVHGTTGYDFANQVMQLLVDSSAETEITKTFHRSIGHSLHFGHLVYAKKLQVMRLARAAHTHFVLKFQQATGPIMAKGLEDTVFYIYNRLAALNEVGGEPQQFGLSIDAFHECNLDRQRNWPATLLATSTHDTKRSEDVRARMVAISELPELWRRSLQRWRLANRRWKRNINEAEAPDGNEEYLLYQTLLGTWPVQPSGVPEAIATAEYIERIQAYMGKALHEAKINTSWIQPNEE